MLTGWPAWRRCRRTPGLLVVIAAVALMASACNGRDGDVPSTAAAPSSPSRSPGTPFSFRDAERTPPELAPFASWIEPALAAHRRAFRIIDANKVDTHAQANDEIRRRLQKRGKVTLDLANALEALPAPPEVEVDIAAYIAAIRLAGYADVDLARCNAKNCRQRIVEDNRAQALFEQAHSNLVLTLERAVAGKDQGGPVATARALAAGASSVVAIRDHQSLQPRSSM
jgi:hypothetical protein